MDMYSWRSMTNAVNKVKVVQPFLLNTIFKNGIERHNSDLITVELIESSASIARFAGKNAPPHPVKNRRRKAYEFSLPRTYESKEFTADELGKYKMSADGTYIGSVQDRENQVRMMITDEVKSLKDRVMNRRELMAAQAIASGAVTVNEEGIIKTADYGFTAGTHLFTYSGTSRWGQSAGDIIGDFIKYPRLIGKRTGDVSSPIICILGYDAADVFRKDVSVMKELNNLNFQVGTLNLNKAPETTANNYIGRYKNVFVYEYGQSVLDESGSTLELFPANRAVFIQPSAHHRIHAGPIYRIDKESKETIKITNEMLMDAQVDRYAQTLEWTLEQKSLPVIHDADSVISIQVL